VSRRRPTRAILLWPAWLAEVEYRLCRRTGAASPLFAAGHSCTGTLARPLWPAG